MSKAFSIQDIDVKAFIEALDRCKGNVILVTSEGDRFNLRSKLSQLTGIINLIEGGRSVAANIICENSEDEMILFSKE